MDNFDSVLKKGNKIGKYHEECEGYGELIKKIGVTKINSCLLITSREEPVEIARLEGKTLPVRKYKIGGIGIDEGKMIFADVGDFIGSEDNWRDLIEFYNGNPLALDLAARHIIKTFDGDISSFLKYGRQIFKKIEELLNWHYERLTDNEKEILYMIAINRIPISFNSIKNDIVSVKSKKRLSDNLEDLQLRIPLEKVNTRFTLQPVLLEFIVDKFTNLFCINLINEDLDFINQFPIKKALTRDFVRNTQDRIILNPIKDALIEKYGDYKTIKEKFNGILNQLRANYRNKAGYAAGNLLNLLCHLEPTVSDLDFSSLTVWNLFAQNNRLHNIDFSCADLSKSLFIQNFGTILCLDFGIDGKFVATGDAMKNIRLWRIKDGQPTMRGSGHSNWIRSVKISPDKKMIASSSEDQTLRVWKISSGQCIKVVDNVNSNIEAIAFSPDSKFIALACYDNTLKIYNLEDDKFEFVLHGHTNKLSDVCYSNDGNILATCGADNTIRIWDVKTKDCLQIMRGHSDKVCTIAFGYDGKTIASGSYDKSIRIWDVDSGECLETIIGHGSIVRAIAFCPNKNHISSCSYDNTIKIWDIDSSSCIKTLRGHTNWVRSIAYSPDGDKIVSGGHDQTIRIWEPKSGNCLISLQGYTNWVLSLCFSSDGEILASGSEDKKVRIWKVSSGKQIRSINSGSRVLSINFSPDDKMFVTGGEDEIVRIWDTNSGQCMRELTGHRLGIRSVQFSKDGKRKYHFIEYISWYLFEK